MKKEYLTYLLTDTLPSELPIIYTNKGLYNYLKNNLDKWESVDFSNTYDTEKNIRPTVPTIFQIRKNDFENRNISIMHPYSQIVCTKFIESYSNTLLDFFTNNSIFSIRSPISINDAYNPSKENRFEKEIEAILNSDINTDDLFNEVYIRTFFTLSKFPKITDFFRSYKIKDLELKYHFMKRIDIKACFDSVYTHSIDWAYLGDKYIAKDLLNTKTQRFSSLFDKVTQSMNYNETNSILIGPEYSRLVAELILTRVDRNVFLSLKQMDLRYKIDFEIIRFVDDYFVFYNNPSHGDCIQSIIAGKLSDFKFNLNENKLLFEQRPFMRKHTWVVQLKHYLNALFDEISWQSDDTARYLMDFYNDVRLLIINYEEQQGFIVSYSLSTIENKIDELINTINSNDNQLKSFLILIDVIVYILNYSLSCDNIIKVCRIFLKIQNNCNCESTNIDNMIFKKCFTLLKYNATQHTELLNLYCLLIYNTNYLPNEFLISHLNEDYLSLCTITYYIINKDKLYYKETIQQINIIISSIIEKLRIRFNITRHQSSLDGFDEIDSAISSEYFILLHDIYSSGILSKSNYTLIDKFKKNITIKNNGKYKLYNIFLNYIKDFDKPFINWNITYEESIQEMYIKKFAKFNPYQTF